MESVTTMGIPARESGMAGDVAGEFLPVRIRELFNAPVGDLQSAVCPKHELDRREPSIHRHSRVFKTGDPNGIRTRVTAVKGRCPNRWTMGSGAHK
jgi:hypothetical protein